MCVPRLEHKSKGKKYKGYFGDVGEKEISSTLIGSVPMVLEIKLSKDRLTEQKGLFHTHMRRPQEIK